jgi:hypothetical protein
MNKTQTEIMEVLRKHRIARDELNQCSDLFKTISEDCEYKSGGTCNNADSTRHKCCPIGCPFDPIYREEEKKSYHEKKPGVWC